MKRLSQTLKVSLAVFLAIFSSGLAQLYTAPEAKAAPKEQVTICHHKGNNTWDSLTAAPEIVFNAGHDTHQDNKDIIPAFEYVKQGKTLSFPGLNYDAAGEAILANDCSAATVSVGELACVAEGATQNVDIVINNLKVVADIYVYHEGGAGPDYARRLQPSTSQTLSVTNLAVGSYSVDIVSGQTIIASTSFTIEACDTTPTTPTYYLQTSHNASVCGQVTISLRNVSPWLYRVLIEQEVSPGVWERVPASTGDPKWQDITPGVMIVDNLGDAPDDQTGTYIVKFAEDSNGGTRNIRYRVSSGTEDDLYLNLQVGTSQNVPVSTDCVKPLPSEAKWLQTACTLNTNTTDLLQIRIVNTDDATDEDVTYVVSVTNEFGASVEKTVTVADGDSTVVDFADLAAGEYEISILASDGTIFEPETITIEQCTATPGSGGGGETGGHTLGGATDTKTPTVLPTRIPATGADGYQNPLVVLIAAVTAYGATFFFQNRRKLAADEA